MKITWFVVPAAFYNP